MKRNKYLTFLFLDDNSPISATFAAQILSLNLAKLFFLNFFITVLCNSSACYSFTLTPDRVFLQKNL